MVGFVDIKQSYGEIDAKFNENSLYQFYPFDPCPDPKWGVVNPTYNNLVKATMKFDNPQTFDFMTNPVVVNCLSIIERYVTPYWIQEPMPWRQVWAEFEVSTSSGFPFGAYGLKTKGDVMKFADAFNDYMTIVIVSDADVIFKCSPKIEFLDLDMIAEGKIRLFNLGPLHFNAVQKRLYSRQNKAIMETRWYKIGTTMKYGGAHRLSKELECADGEFVVEFDIPRCDKNFKLMRWIYTLRNKCLKLTTEMDRRGAAWVARNISKAKVALFDGTVIESETVNPSGQNNTADDTCPWNNLLILTLASLACPEATYAELSALTLHIYSDDFRGKFPRRFGRLRDSEWVARQLSDVFQVTAKAEDWKIYDGPDGSHFLGADTVLRRGIYWACYNPDRLRAAFKFTEGRLTTGQELFRLCQLLVQAYPHHEMYLEFREIYSTLLQRFGSSQDLEVQIVVARGLPSEAELLRVHTGLEAFSRVSFDFSGSTEVGGVKRIRMNGIKNANDKANQLKGKLAKRGTHPSAGTEALRKRLDTIVESAGERGGTPKRVGDGPGAKGRGPGNKVSVGGNAGGGGSRSTPGGTSHGNVRNLAPKPAAPKPAPQVLDSKMFEKVAEKTFAAMNVPKPALRQLVQDKRVEMLELEHESAVNRLRSALSLTPEQCEQEYNRVVGLVRAAKKRAPSGVDPFAEVDVTAELAKWRNDQAPGADDADKAQAIAVYEKVERANEINARLRAYDNALNDRGPDGLMRLLQSERDGIIGQVLGAFTAKHKQAMRVKKTPLKTLVGGSAMREVHLAPAAGPRRGATKKDFDDRLRKIGAHSGSKGHERASWLKERMVGAAEGTVYHGSESIEMEEKHEGKYGMRVAGHQLLFNISTGSTSLGAGNRIDGIPFAPIALGGRLAQLAMLFEQCKLNHCMLVWRPSVGTGANGNVCCYYRADTGVETQEIGFTEYDMSSQHPNYLNTPVWDRASMDIDPQNANVRYADAFNSDFADDIQGQLIVESGNNLAINTTFGDFFLEYDVSFWSATLDPAINFQGTTTCQLKFNQYTGMTSGFSVAFNGWPDAATRASFNFATPPGSAEFLVMLFVRTITTGTNSGILVWNSPNNQDATQFNAGQLLWGRFSMKGPLSWTSGQNILVLYRDQDSASGSVLVNSSASVALAADGQLTWINTDASPATMTVDCFARFIPLNPNA